MVEYLSGGRVQGSSTAEANTTVTDDLTSDTDWVSTVTGNGYNATYDRVDFKISCPPDDSSFAGGRVLIDLQDSDWLDGSNLATNFVMRFKWKLTDATLVTSGSETRAYLGFFSDDAWGGTSQDYFGVQVFMNSSQLYPLRVECIDGGTFQGGTETRTDTTLTPVEDTQYYFELKKVGDVHSFTVTTNSDYTGGQTVNVTKTGITNLRYFGVKSRGDSQSANGIIEGYISPDIKLWNNVTSVTEDEKTTITNVPANTRYEETDTRKIYRKVTPTSVTYESDFANNSTGWSTSNARGGFDTTGAWSYNETSTPSNSAKINYDLGSSIDTEFVLRWRMKTASGTKPSNYTYFYLVEQDSLTPTNGTGFVWQGSTNKINIGTQSAEPSSSFTITANTWNYFELVRTSLSTNGIKLYQYTDSNYTSPTLLLTSSGSTTGDERYIQLKSTHNGSVTTKVYVDGIKFYNDATSVSTDEWKERNTA